MIQEKRDNIEAHQPLVMVEESAETACSQSMQDAVQEPPSDFAALSDAPTSWTCTLTPTSVSKMEKTNKFSQLTTSRP